MPYHELDPQRLTQTIARVERRIAERFPASGLLKIAGEVRQVAERAGGRMAEIAKPHRALRILSSLLVLLIGGGVGILIWYAHSLAVQGSLADFLQMIEAGANIVLVCSAALYSSDSLERRVKRRRALGALMELRALAHVIDMHQLTKDPCRINDLERDTENSPERDLDTFLLSRYLNYCSELVSLIAKLAALYTRSIDDSAVLESADSLELLCVAISRKVWQKIGIASNLAT